MQVPIEEVEQFFRIHRALMCFINRELQILPGRGKTPGAYAKLDPGDRFRVHEALVGRLDLIDRFVAENPFRLDEEDRAIARSWRDMVSGSFYALRQLRGHMIFLSDGEPAVAYGVLALFNSFDELIGPDLPRMVRTTLLPFRGRIVYDGLISSYNVSLGPGIRRRLNETYRAAKDGPGIITSLPGPTDDPGTEPASAPAARKSRKAGKAVARETAVPAAGKRPAVPAAARAAHDRIVELMDAFCGAHLDEEYAELCRRMAGALARKRPSPIVRGKPESWAAGIVRSVGFCNFLGDPAQPHHMKMSDVDRGFGVSEATGSAKGTLIRRLLNVDRFGAEWTLSSQMGRNPLIWLLSVNGLMMDIRHCPREAQAVAYQQGLIPYIPADRGEGPTDD